MHNKKAVTEPTIVEKNEEQLGSSLKKYLEHNSTTIIAMDIRIRHQRHHFKTTNIFFFIIKNIRLL
jgi:hypothetical protein